MSTATYTLTSKEWCQLYNHHEYWDQIKHLILRKIGEVDRTYAEWKAIFEDMSNKEMLRMLARKKMGETAQTFAEWEFIYEHSSDDLKELAFQKMSKLLKIEQAPKAKEAEKYEKNKKNGSCFRQLVLSLEKFFKRDKGTCLPSETVTYPNEMTM
ncbi:MAG: hypothetical protein LBD11_05680 [Candidatus Peribacteria bacterium]|jgi:hypothetical protein|nr:hypothetical protein [Candidatus Peribacteria bacterium]